VQHLVQIWSDWVQCRFCAKGSRDCEQSDLVNEEVNLVKARAQPQALQHVIYEAGALLFHYTNIVPLTQARVNSAFQHLG
jgi:hypothetical protein